MIRNESQEQDFSAYKTKNLQQRTIGSSLFGGSRSGVPSHLALDTLDNIPIQGSPSPTRRFTGSHGNSDAALLPRHYEKSPASRSPCCRAAMPIFSRISFFFSRGPARAKSSPVTPPVPSYRKRGSSNYAQLLVLGAIASFSGALVMLCSKSVYKILGGCVDDQVECGGWAALGECERNSPYMSVHCPKVCGMCGMAKNDGMNFVQLQQNQLEELVRAMERRGAHEAGAVSRGSNAAGGSARGNHGGGAAAAAGTGGRVEHPTGSRELRKFASELPRGATEGSMVAERHRSALTVGSWDCGPQGVRGSMMVRGAAIKRTLSMEQINDDYCDCVDGSDEVGTSACSGGTAHFVPVGFYCKARSYGDLPLPASRVNDGVCDCCDGSDEYNQGVHCRNRCAELELERRDTEKRMAAGRTKRAEMEDLVRREPERLVKAGGNELQLVGATAFGALVDKCYTSAATGEYTYELCLFKYATQKRPNDPRSPKGVSLGRVWTWERMGFSAILSEGDACPGGRPRSLRIEFECDDRSSLGTVSEMGTCSYTTKVWTPAACAI